LLCDEPAGESNRLAAALDAHHATRSAHSLGKEIETAVRTAANLDDAGSLGDADLIEQPARFVGELLCLLLQTLLFRLAVAETVLIGLGHASR
jgi:hypothetical protein